MNINFIEGSIFEGMADDGKTTKFKPGDSEWSTYDNEINGLLFVCPCGCGMVRSVPVSGPRKWQWDGNKEKPTLTPSILIIGECGWHGFLTNGEFRTC